MSEKAKKIIFVCIHNAGRSQMAAAFAVNLGGDSVRVLSAGSAPASQVNPVAVEAMAELGIDIARTKPKLLSDESVQHSDVVITMGCGDTCPVYPGKRYLDWDVADPAGQSIKAVRLIRDDIRGRVEGLLKELGV